VVRIPSLDTQVEVVHVVGDPDGLVVGDGAGVVGLRVVEEFRLGGPVGEAAIHRDGGVNGGLGEGVGGDAGELGGTAGGEDLETVGDEDVTAADAGGVLDIAGDLPFPAGGGDGEGRDADGGDGAVVEVAGLLAVEDAALEEELAGDGRRAGGLEGGVAGREVGVEVEVVQRLREVVGVPGIDAEVNELGVVRDPDGLDVGGGGAVVVFGVGPDEG